MDAYNALNGKTEFPKPCTVHIVQGFFYSLYYMKDFSKAHPKKRWKRNRAILKKRLKHLIDRSIATSIVYMHRAKKHRQHIYQIWEMLLYHPEFKAAYNDQLGGGFLCGYEDFHQLLSWIDVDLYLESMNNFPVPSVYAHGDALAIAYSVLKKESRS